MAIFKFCTILINDVNPSLLRTSFLAPRDATGLSIAKQDITLQVQRCSCRARRMRFNSAEMPMRAVISSILNNHNFVFINKTSSRVTCISADDGL